MQRHFSGGIHLTICSISASHHGRSQCQPEEQSMQQTSRSRGFAGMLRCQQLLGCKLQKNPRENSCSFVKAEDWRVAASALPGVVCGFLPQCPVCDWDNLITPSEGLYILMECKLTGISPLQPGENLPD